MFAKYKEADFGGKKLYLAYTASAMLDINDVLGKEQDIAEVLSDNKKDSLKQFCDIVEIMARYGNTIRKLEGHKVEKKQVTSDQLLICMTPVEYLALKKAAMDAVMAGYGREIVDENEEIDLGLAELEKKTDQPGHM